MIFGILVAHTFQLIGQDRRREEIQSALTELEKFGEVTFVIKRKDAGTLNQLTYQISIAKLTENELTGYANSKQFTRFLRTGIPFEVVPHTPVKRIPNDQRKDLAEWTTYPSRSEYDSIMKKFESDYPAICLLDTIGYSVDGKTILMLKISDNVSLDESEPHFLYTSTMHGDETGGFVLMLRLADMILQNYGIDPRITGMVDNLQIWINPLANPDGFYRSYDSLYIPIRSNANGVDLNRNFPDPEDGPHPDGNQYQPETVAMMEFMKEFSPVMSANFHGGAEVVNYPWDTWQTSEPEEPGYYSPHPDDSWFQLVSKEYADSVQFYSPTGYFTNPSSSGYTLGGNWYMISGGRQDYVTYFLHGREVTIELDITKITPEADLENLWQYNYRSLLNYLEHALFGIRGTVKDAVTGDPVQAKIEIPDHDSDSSHVYSDSLHGDYYRLIEEGTYQMRFTAPGYYDKTIPDVIVQNRQKTRLDLQMVPLKSARIQLSSPESKMSCFPNPFRNTLTVSFELNQPAHLEFQIYDILGKKQMVPYSSFHSTGKIQVNLDLNRLPPGTYIIRSVITGLVMDQKIIKKL